MGRGGSRAQAFWLCQNLGLGGFTPPRQNQIRGPREAGFAGQQVRIPMSEVKNYIAERIKF